jgi:hypothetical protein
LKDFYREKNAFMEKRFPDIPSLLSACLVHDEYPDTAPLITSLSHVREVGFFHAQRIPEHVQMEGTT